MTGTEPDTETDTEPGTVGDAVTDTSAPAQAGGPPSAKTGGPAPTQTGGSSPAETGGPSLAETGGADGSSVAVAFGRRLRSGSAWTAGLGGLFLSVALAITIGPADIGVVDVWSTVVAHLGWGHTELTPIRDGIVWNLRLPRTLLAAVCGAGLAVCGAVMQSLLRNPLADPFVLGVSSGASTGAVVVVVLGVGGGALSVSGGAFLGAVASFGLVLLLSHTLGGTTDRVVLVGVAAMQLFSALTSFMVMTAADAETTRAVLFWLLGSLSGADWTDVTVCLVVLVVVLLVCLGHTHALDAFAFGQDAAASLGVSVARTRLVLLCATALLTAALVASSGAIGFVGLVLPHAARALTGSGHSRLLPATALAGAVFLVWVDTLARTVLDPQEVPVGVVTSLIGVPAFVAIMYRTRSTR